jgi:hypothetical protein
MLIGFVYNNGLLWLSKRGIHSCGQTFQRDFFMAGVITGRHNGGEATSPQLNQSKYEYKAIDSDRPVIASQ